MVQCSEWLTVPTVPSQQSPQSGLGGHLRPLVEIIELVLDLRTRCTELLVTEFGIEHLRSSERVRTDLYAAARVGDGAATKTLRERFGILGLQSTALPQANSCGVAWHTAQQTGKIEPQ